MDEGRAAGGAEGVVGPRAIIDVYVSGGDSQLPSPRLYRSESDSTQLMSR